MLGTFGKNRNFQKNIDFARVTFQFFGQGGSTFRRISGLTARSFQGLVRPRAVLAGVAEPHRKNQLEGLNVSLAVGPFILGSGARKESASHHVWKGL